MVSIASILLVLIISTVSLEGAPTASDCGGSGDMIKLQSFKLLTSHPSKKGQLATFEMSMDLKQDIAQPINTHVQMEFQVLGFWIKGCLPSSNNCAYDDFCQDLCIGCTCDFKQGTRSLAMSMNITSAVNAGKYRSTINFTSASGQKGCVYIQGLEVQ